MMTSAQKVVQIPDEKALLVFAKQLCAFFSKGGVIYLQGPLGVGKTTLVRCMLRAMGYDGVVKSPSYTLVESYALNDLMVYHCDLYRLSSSEECEFLDRDAWTDPNTLLLVEWADHGGNFLPAADLVCDLQYADAGRRIHLDFIEGGLTGGALHWEGES